MKRATLCLLLLGLMASGQVQKVIQLEETKVNSDPKFVMVKYNNNVKLFKVQENYEGEFANNPIGYVKANFNMENYMNSVKKEKYDSYEISFESRKGGIRADFNKKGELVKTFQKFKDVVLPVPLIKQVVEEYNGWDITGNSYTARGTKGKIHKETYRIFLKKGTKRQKIKITPNRQLVVTTINY